VTESPVFDEFDELFPGLDEQPRDFIRWHKEAGNLLDALVEELANYLREREHLPSLAKHALDDAKLLAEQVFAKLQAHPDFGYFSETIYVRFYNVVLALMGILKKLTEANFDRREFVEKTIDEFLAITPRYQTDVKRIARGCVVMIEKRERAIENDPDSVASEPTRTKAKRPGRKKANYETVQHEAKLAAEWARALDNGVYKADFAKEQGMTQKDFARLLSRVRKRNTARNNSRGK